MAVSTRFRRLNILKSIPLVNVRHVSTTAFKDSNPEERLLALAARSYKSHPLLQHRSNPASIKDFEAQQSIASSLPSDQDATYIVDVLFKTIQRYNIACSPELAVMIIKVAVTAGNLAAAKRFLSLFPQQYTLDPSDAKMLMRTLIDQLDTPASSGHRFGAWQRADALRFLIGPGLCLHSIIDTQGDQRTFSTTLYHLGVVDLDLNLHNRPRKEHTWPVGPETTEQAVQQIERILLPS